jgi:hypothetical protein
MPAWMKAGDRAYRATLQKPAGEYYRLTVEGTPESKAQWEWVAWTSGWSCQGYSQSAIEAMKDAERAIERIGDLPSIPGEQRTIGRARVSRPH